MAFVFRHARRYGGCDPKHYVGVHHQHVDGCVHHDFHGHGHDDVYVDAGGCDYDRDRDQLQPL